MRIAVLSDIHGNWFALQSVLNDAVRRERVTQVWCLGDLVGYGPRSLRCYEELSELESNWGISMGSWIAGNHDWGLAGRIPIEYPLFQPEAKWVLQQTKYLAGQDEETKSRFDQMCESLAARHTFTESPQAGVWLMHGQVTADKHGKIDEQANVTGEHSYIRDRQDNVWKAEKSWRALGRQAADASHKPRLILAGHTHEPLLWQRFGKADWRADPLPDGERLPPTGWLEGCPKCGPDGPCKSSKRWAQSITLLDQPALINPGSVGQPRDGCPAAAYVILDFEAYRTHVTFKRVGYDVQATKDALAQLAKKKDGTPDLEAMSNHVEKLRTRLVRGE